MVVKGYPNCGIKRRESKYGRLSDIFAMAFESLVHQVLSRSALSSLSVLVSNTRMLIGLVMIRGLTNKLLEPANNVPENSPQLFLPP